MARIPPDLLLIVVLTVVTQTRAMAMAPWRALAMGDADMDEDDDGMCELPEEVLGELESFDASAKKWPDGVVPYTIDYDSYGELTWQQFWEITNPVEYAIKEIEKRTCIKFRRVNHPIDPALDHVVVKNGSGCWSHIGRKGGGAQPLTLQYPECLIRSVTLHEMVHALGFLHTFVRPDRDNYVKINTENIIDGKEKQFTKVNASYDFGYPFDYDSVMQYTKTAFSKNGRETITPLWLPPNHEIGDRELLSFSDAMQLNKLYNCMVIYSQNKVVTTNAFHSFLCALGYCA